MQSLTHTTRNAWKYLVPLACAMAFVAGLSMAQTAEKPKNAPARPDEQPRGHFQPSDAYMQRFSHAPAQVRKVPPRQAAERPMTPGAALLQLEQLRQERREAIHKMENETEYRPAPAPAAPTPLFRLPGAGK